MPTINVEQSLLRKFVESRGRVHNVEDMAFRLPLMGTDIDTCDEDVLDIEIFPDLIQYATQLSAKDAIYVSAIQELSAKVTALENA